jgi:hypothetical protein
MKIAKLNTTPIQSDINDYIDNYYEVPDTYDFSGNSADDVTSIETLMVFCEINRYDYDVLRTTYKTLYNPIWSGLTFDDRQLLVKHYCYPPEITQDEWFTYYTDAEHYNNWNTLVIRTRDQSRLIRLFSAFARISYELTTAQTAVIYMTSKVYCIDYYYGNLPHLVLWISNGYYPALGIDFRAHGFAQMDGYSDGLRDRLLDIINNGNYIY